MNVPDVLDMSAMEACCPQTINGWLWYCDEHDTHGNADSEEEGEHMAEAHSEFHALLAVDDVNDPESNFEHDDDCTISHVRPLAPCSCFQPEHCDVLVWQRFYHERIDPVSRG